MEWQLAEAKNRFSELVSRALTEGPQRVRRRKDTVVLVSGEEFDRLSGKKVSFKEFLLNGPDMTGIEFARDSAPMREVNLGEDEL